MKYILIIALLAILANVIIAKSPPGGRYDSSDDDDDYERKGGKDVKKIKDKPFRGRAYDGDNEYETYKNEYQENQRQQSQALFAICMVCLVIIVIGCAWRTYRQKTILAQLEQQFSQQPEQGQQQEGNFYPQQAN